MSDVDPDATARIIDLAGLGRVKPAAPMMVTCRTCTGTYNGNTHPMCPRCADGVEDGLGARTSSGLILPEPVDWAEFWSRQTPEPEWLVEPVIPEGRGVVIYADRKLGKSLLAVDIAAGIACGRAVLGNLAGDPMSVIYLDLEMSEDDVRERLADMGYGAEVDMGNLHYYLLPTLPPLDKPAGGAALLDLVRLHAARFVVIDTMGRAVDGPENDADTYRAFWTNTGKPIKAAGVTSLRLDHTGKDDGKGPRGSSSKGDDPDVIWQLKREDRSGLVLVNDGSRVPWVPERVHLVRDEDPRLVHKVSTRGWPEGTAETARALDRLRVPIDASAEKARATLTAAGQGKRKTVVLAAQRYRREKRQGPC